MGGEHGYRPDMDVMELFRLKKCVKIAAPMVRFSKLPFRHVVRSYGTDLVYTPMIMADSFTASAKARDVELTTNSFDKPVVVQFAAKSAKQFADAAELVAGKVAAVDLNCGCPQRWAIQEGVGCALLKQPELVKAMVREASARSALPVSIKIRIAADIRETVEIVQRAQAVGVAWVTVHGRRADSKPSDPVDLDAIRLVREHACVPLVANGSIHSLADVEHVHERTGCAGAMAARGLLVNPGMFAGYVSTPRACVGDYVASALHFGSRFEVFSKTLEWMLCEQLNKTDRMQLNACVSVAGIVDFLRSRDLPLTPSPRLLPL